MKKTNEILLIIRNENLFRRKAERKNNHSKFWPKGVQQFDDIGTYRVEVKHYYILTKTKCL